MLYCHLTGLSLLYKLIKSNLIRIIFQKQQQEKVLQEQESPIGAEPLILKLTVKGTKSDSS
jgi:hypothetical protein